MTNNTRLRIKLKSGEVKTFPWCAVTFTIRVSDGLCSVYEIAEGGLLLFRAPLENVEYIERINDGE